MLVTNKCDGIEKELGRVPNVLVQMTVMDDNAIMISIKSRVICQRRGER